MNDEQLAAALATGALTIVRRLRAADRYARLSGPQASALGVIIHSGSIRMSRLAQLEEVSRPAITKTVAQLEALGLAVREPDDEDGRVSLISPTFKGKQLFQDGHVRRTAPLAAAIGKLTVFERDTLIASVGLTERLIETIRRADDAAALAPGAQHVGHDAGS